MHILSPACGVKLVYHVCLVTTYEGCMIVRIEFLIAREKVPVRLLCPNLW